MDIPGYDVSNQFPKPKSTTSLGCLPFVIVFLDTSIRIENYN
jgi:hypothetical protein